MMTGDFLRGIKARCRGLEKTALFSHFSNVRPPARLRSPTSFKGMSLAPPECGGLYSFVSP